jgi:hypothetical protein
VESDVALACTFCVFVGLEFHDFEVIEVGLLMRIEHFQRESLSTFTRLEEVSLELAHAFLNIVYAKFLILLVFLKFSH